MGGDFDEKTRGEIRQLLETDQAKLADAFAGRLAFGTGGMRGVVGVGTNRMNLYTVSFATQGIANFLKEKFKDRAIKVALSCDTRLFSAEFTEQTARVFAGNGIDVVLLDGPYPVPVLSFTCRHHKCQAGIMMTASHNPPEYNGYKVYGDDGSQVVFPDDATIIKHVALVEHPRSVRFAEKGDKHIQFAPPETITAYFEALAELNPDKTLVGRAQSASKELRVVYTPLHGAGATCTPRALTQWGFKDVVLVDEQMIPDGHFPTVAAPNPEESSALALGLQKMKAVKADLLIANDPDSDRMGSVAMGKFGPRILSGNEAGALLLHHLCITLRERGRLPKSGAVIKSLVTSDLLHSIATHFGLQTFDVPPGFKYIAALIRQWKEQSSSLQFVFGAEESLGYLTGDHARDKDGVLAGCLMASCAQKDKLKGKTLLDHLYELYAQFGVFRDKHLNIDVSPGRAGAEQIAAMLKKLREEPPKVLAGLTVTTSDKSQGANRVCEPEKGDGAHDLKMIYWRLGKGGKLIARPSGTEPKIKFYLFSHIPPAEMGDVEEALMRSDQQLDQLAKELQGLVETTKPQ